MRISRIVRSPITVPNRTSSLCSVCRRASTLLIALLTNFLELHRAADATVHPLTSLHSDVMRLLLTDCVREVSDPRFRWQNNLVKAARNFPLMTLYKMGFMHE